MKTYSIRRGKNVVGTVQAESIEAARIEAVRLDPKNSGATIRREKNRVGSGLSQFTPDDFGDIDPRDYVADSDCVDCGGDPCECSDR